MNVLLIPGTGASTISVTDKKTNKKVYAWVGNTDYIKNGTNFMTCHWNRKTKQVEPFCKNYYNTSVEDGIKNCQYIVNCGKIKLGKYYSDIVDMLHKLGYEDYKTLHIFSYDWRQPLRNTCLKMNEFIKENIQGKIIVIAHSLGNVLFDTYMKMFDDFQDYIIKYIALAPPYNGLGYVSLQMLINGYDMQSPLPQSVCKQIQLSSACFVEMNSKDNGPIVYIKRGKEQVKENSEEDYIDWDKVKFMRKQDQYSLPYEIALTMYNERYKILRDEFILLQSFCKKGDIILDGYQQKKEYDIFQWMEMQQRREFMFLDYGDDEYTMEKYSCEKLYDLNKLMYPSGTLLGFLYQVDDDMIQYINEVKAKKIRFNDNFEIYIYGGYGYQSYGDCMINDIVHDYKNIPKMWQSKFEDIGDGTVVLKSVLGYEYPQHLIKECYIKNNSNHVYMLYSNNLLNKLSEWVTSTQ